MDTPEMSADEDERYGATKHTLERLGLLYSMEASAARSYDKVLALPYLAPYREALGSNRSSHEERIRLLSERILLAGGEPPQTQSISDSLLELLDDATATLTVSDAVAVLEYRERDWLRRYGKMLNKLVRENRRFVEEELMPRQLQSRGMMHAIGHPD
jgi:hypothetical protein